MRVGAVIVAGGRGARFGGPPKQWRVLAGRTVAAHALSCLREVAELHRVALVHHPEDRAEARALARPGLIYAEGGATRAASVRAGLEALAPDPPDVVLVHDAARPCASPALVARLLGALREHEGAAPAIPVTDALWRGDGGRVAATVPREGLWRAQTPQGFRFAAILAAHRRGAEGALDDVEVARAAGLAVVIVPGEEDNLKVTTAPDLDRARAILEGRVDVRTGNGFDVHAFGPGDQVTLCGVAIPHDRGLVGHSDADVGLHALTDAVLGAIGEGDIGTHFPPSEPRWRGCDSRVFVAHARNLARERGFQVANADVTLVCEAPRVGPHAAAMRRAMAEALGVGEERVSVKATTSEGMGFTGRGEGIVAMATATLVRA